MDIYKWAEEYDYLADYYDPHTGLIHKCTEAKYHDGKIPVYDAAGNFISFDKKAGEGES